MYHIALSAPPPNSFGGIRVTGGWGGRMSADGWGVAYQSLKSKIVKYDIKV